MGSGIDSTVYGIMYGVHRTTIYLPSGLKTAIEMEARRGGVTEAEVIRRAVAEHLGHLGPPSPVLPLFPEGLGVDLIALADDDL
jgi:hypothetical protein